MLAAPLSSCCTHCCEGLHGVTSNTLKDKHTQQRKCVSTNGPRSEGTTLWRPLTCEIVRVRVVKSSSGGAVGGESSPAGSGTSHLTLLAPGSVLNKLGARAGHKWKAHSRWVTETASKSGGICLYHRLYLTRGIPRRGKYFGVLVALGATKWSCSEFHTPAGKWRCFLPASVVQVSVSMSRSAGARGGQRINLQTRCQRKREVCVRIWHCSYSGYLCTSNQTIFTPQKFIWLP